MNFNFKGKNFCDTAVLTCVDFRFRDIYKKGIEEVFEIENYDIWAVPGAGKNFVDPNNKEFALALITKIKEVSSGLQNIRELVVLNHQDCQGYGGRQAFKNLEAETIKHTEDLRAAKEVLEKEFPGVNVRIGLAMLSEDKDKSAVVEII